MPYRPSPGPATRMVVACRMARRRAWSSRAVVSVAGHGVPYGPVRAVSPVAGSRAIRPVAGSHAVTFRPTSATSRLCGGYGRVRRTPVVGHAPAQLCLSPTPPTAVCKHLFFYRVVALYECSFGGAAKARRWAALTSCLMPNRRAPHISATHGVEQSGHNRT